MKKRFFAVFSLILAAVFLVACSSQSTGEKNWEKIEKRLLLASEADFVICLYNPSSKKRKDYLARACDILLEYKEESIICGIVRNIAREEESMNILTLKKLRNTEVDMFSTVYIGNKMTKIIKDKMVTPRGYRYDRK